MAASSRVSSGCSCSAAGPCGGRVGTQVSCSISGSACLCSPHTLPAPRHAAAGSDPQRTSRGAATRASARAAWVGRLTWRRRSGASTQAHTAPHPRNEGIQRSTSSSTSSELAARMAFICTSSSLPAVRRSASRTRQWAGPAAAAHWATPAPPAAPVHAATPAAGAAADCALDAAGRDACEKAACSDATAAANGPEAAAAEPAAAAAPPAEAPFALSRGTLSPRATPDDEEGSGEAANVEGTGGVGEGAAAAEAAVAEGAAAAAPENAKSRPERSRELALEGVELGPRTSRHPVGEGAESNIALWSDVGRPLGGVDPCFSRLSRDPLRPRPSPCGCDEPVEGSAGDLAESARLGAATPRIGADGDGCSATAAANRDEPSAGALDNVSAHAASGWRGAEGGRGDEEGAAKWASAEGAPAAAAAAGLGALHRGAVCACGGASFASGAREGIMARLLMRHTRRGASGTARTGRWERRAAGRRRWRRLGSQ